MIQNIGFIQGRLSDLIDNQIQAFPWGSWQDEFKSANKLGLSLMEWTLDQKNLHSNPLMTSSGQIEILKLCSSFDISIPSITCDCFMQEPFWKASNKLTIKNLKNDFQSILIACSKLGIKNIVVPLVDNGSINSDIQENALINYLNSNHKKLIALNLNIVFESDFLPDKLKIFIDKFDKNNFGINYDTGNSASYGHNPVEEFECIGERILNVHIKDRPKNGTTVSLGSGDVDFDLVIKLLYEYNYKANLILQTARAEDNNHEECLLLYKKFLEEIIIKHNHES